MLALTVYSGAWELIEAWWAKEGKKNPHAHLKPDTVSEADEDEEMKDAEPTPEPEPAPKKRGRPSAADRTVERRKSEVKEDADTKKRGRKSNGVTTVSAPPTKKARRTSSPPASVKNEAVETVIHPTKLANWKDRKDWSSYVSEITTIEHDDKKLHVYFKLYVPRCMASAAADAHPGRASKTLAQSHCVLAGSASLARYVSVYVASASSNHMLTVARLLREEPSLALRRGLRRRGQLVKRIATEDSFFALPAHQNLPKLCLASTQYLTHYYYRFILSWLFISNYRLQQAMKAGRETNNRTPCSRAD